MQESAFFQILNLNGMRLSPSDQRTIVRQCHSTMAFSQHATQGGQFINFKDALKLLHIDSDHTNNDINDLRWVIRSQPSSKQQVRDAMGAGSSLLQNATGGSSLLVNDVTDVVKRAKTPMLNRLDHPLKQRLTIQNIERMETQVKDHVDNMDHAKNANTTNNSPKSHRGSIDFKV